MGSAREESKAGVHRPTMPAASPPSLTSVNPFALLLPFVVVTVGTTVLAGLAAALDWHRPQMLALFSVAASACAATALLLAYRQRTDRSDARHAVESMAARMGGVVESAMDAIITVDEDQRIVQFNAAAELVFGYPRSEAIGTPLSAFMPERYRAHHAGHVRKFGETGETSRRMGASRVVSGLRRNGEEFPIDASISQLVEDGKRFYTVILRDVTERLASEKALEASRVEVRELALNASTAREQEKARFARELHDELGQSLTALQIDLAWLRDELPQSATAMRDKLSSMQGLVDSTVSSARRISADLRPLMLDDLGLVAACDWLVQNVRQRSGIECELAVGEGDLDLPDPYATALFRVLQESLTNVTKHSGATQVEVNLVLEDGDVVLSVRDNGRGFSAGARKPGTHGLTGLRERASLLEGTVVIESKPGRGTLVEMRLPFEETPSST